MNHNRGKPWDNPTERRSEGRMVIGTVIGCLIAILFLLWVCKTYGQAPEGTEKSYGGSLGDAARTAAGAVSAAGAFQDGYRAGVRDTNNAYRITSNPDASRAGSPQYDAESLGGRDVYSAMPGVGTIATGALGGNPYKGTICDY